MNRLHVYARLIRCRALAYECLSEGACSVAVWAFEKGLEARQCSDIVLGRAEAALSAQEGP